MLDSCFTLYTHKHRERERERERERAVPSIETRYRLENPQQVWHDKGPSLPKGRKCRTQVYVSHKIDFHIPYFLIKSVYNIKLT